MKIYTKSFLLAGALLTGAFLTHGQSVSYFSTWYGSYNACPNYQGVQIVSGTRCHYEVRGTPASTVNGVISQYPLSNGGSTIERGTLSNGQGYRIYQKDWTSSATLCLSPPGDPCIQSNSVVIVPPTGSVTITSVSHPSNSMCQDVSQTTYTWTAPNAEYYNPTLTPAAAGSISTAGGSPKVINWNTGWIGTATLTVRAGRYAYGDVEKVASIQIVRTQKLTYSATLTGPSLICSAGPNVTFTTSVSGNYGTLTYAWYRGGSQVQSGPSNTYTVSPSVLSNGQQVYCVVSSTGCFVSPVQTSPYYIGITPTVTPTVSVNINSNYFCNLKNATLTASGSHFGPGTTFVWREGSSTGPILSSSTSPTLSIPVYLYPANDSRLAPGETIHLTVSNLTGNCLTTTTLTSSNSWNFTVEALPNFPAIELRCNNGVLELEREHGPNIFWQTSDAGESTSDTVTLKVNPPAGTYFLKKRAASGCWSMAITRTVAPLATGGVVSSTQGFAPFTGSVTASGFSGSIKKWQKRIGNGVWYDVNYTGSIYFFNGLEKTTQFRVLLTNGNNCIEVASAAGTVTIEPRATVFAVGAGGFSYGGDETLILSTQVYNSYQWYKDGVAINNGTNQTVEITETGMYRVDVVKNGFTSQSANYKVGSLGEQKGVNVVSTTNVRVPGITPSTDFFTLDRSQIVQAVKYDDGLGRTIQQSVVGQTPGVKDLVQAVAYDQYGRAARQYLPYVTTNPGGGLKPNALSSGGSYTSSEQYQFYQTASKVAHDTAPYAQSVFDDTPLGRLIEQGAPGAAWQPGTNHTLKNVFRVNTTEDNVRIWTAAGPKTTAPTNYAAGLLSVSKTTDENGNEVLQFVDKLGRLLLKRVQVGDVIEGFNTEYLDTYYVYDIRGNLALQVPPKAAHKISLDSAWTPGFMNNWCFQYYYDEKNRLMEKKVPGSGIISYVYDPLDRIVLVQDAELKLANKWLFVKYDSRQRPVMQGVYLNATNTTRALVQDSVVNKKYKLSPDPYFESRGATLHGYTNQSFPTENADASAIQILSANYYDDYDFNFDSSPDYSYLPQGLPGESTQASAYGLPTGSKKVIEGTTDWLVNYQFYDKYTRVIQTGSNSYFNLSAYELMTRTYDFEGKVIRELTSHPEIQPLTWKNMVNVSVVENKISKTAGGAAWNAGTSSNELLGAGQDGWLEIVVTEINTNRMIGFSDVDSDQNYTTLDYAFYLLNSATLQVRENGANRLSVPGNITTGTRLRIERKSGTIRYYKNDSLVYASATPSSSILMVDNSLHTVGATLSKVWLSSNHAPLATAKRYAYDFSGRPLHVFQSINGQPEILTVSYEYNELGQVVEKNLHCLDCTDPDVSSFESSVGTTLVRDAYSNSEQVVIASQSITLSPGFTVPSGSNFRARVVSQAVTPPPGGGTYAQSVDMRYNIRGWLTSLNNAQLTNDGSLNDDTGDYFGMELSYNTADAGIGNTPYYNGNISAIKWKNPLSGAGAAGQRSYKYAYDKSDRLKSGTFQARGASLWDQELNTLNESMTYDHNGNIKTMLRNSRMTIIEDVDSVTTAAQVMDNLAYTYATGSGNRLTKVEDSGTTDGFKNGASVGTEYTYNNNGSLKTDLNKGISTAVTYNALGKPLQMTFADGRKITYLYDGSGNKLSMKVYQGSTLVKTTDYVGGYLYENRDLAFFSSPGGRVVKKGDDNFEYQYAITDHQGNTRVLFGTDTPAPDTYAATFETNTQTNEQNTFQNYPTGGGRSSLEMFDHTDFAGSTYTYSQLLNGGMNGQVGLAKSLKVYPGDTVKAEVYAKYWNETSTTGNLSGFATALTAAFGLTAGATGEMLKAYTALNDFGSVVVANNGSGSPAGPKAFITMLLFDNNFNLVDATFDQIDPGAEQGATAPKAAFDRLMVSYKVEKPGYAYIYLSNENPTLVDVYFDDMTITQTKSPVLQYNEYYPFGMQTTESWTRENTTDQFLYNSSTELNGTSGFYDLAFRNYDPVLGRFVQVDPLASKYGGLSPYNYGSNNPILFNDPAGLSVTPTTPHQAGCSYCDVTQGGKDNTGGEYSETAAVGGYGVLFNIYTGGSFSRNNYSHLERYVNPNSDFANYQRDQASRGNALQDYGEKGELYDVFEEVTTTRSSPGGTSSTTEVNFLGHRIKTVGGSLVWSDVDDEYSNQARNLPPGEYMIKRGETLFSISKKFRISISDLKRINGIGTKIKAGQRIKVDRAFVAFENLMDLAIRYKGSRSYLGDTPLGDWLRGELNHRRGIVGGTEYEWRSLEWVNLVPSVVSDFFHIYSEQWRNADWSTRAYIFDRYPKD